MRYFLVIALLCGMTAPALAQQAQQPAPQAPAANNTPAPAATPTAEAPPEPKVTKNGDWYVGCQDITVDSKSVEMCEMQQIIEETRSGQAFIRISILYPYNAAKPFMRIVTPIGVRLKEGLKMQIDEGNTIALPYSVCVDRPKPACVVDGVLENNVVTAMKRGNAGTLTLSFGPKRIVTAPFSLTGFTKSIKAIARN